MAKTRTVKDALKQVLLEKDGDPNAQATEVLVFFSWIFESLSRDEDIIEDHRKLIKELAKGFRDDATN